ncbi:Phosphorylated carbohydrates phosphatase [Hordeum vulgare]|nr:Phosphorylated carbohydrates phosphatase [Hordeum vulgare]
MLMELEKDERLLAWVYHRSLTTAETDTRRLRWKNAKALRLAIEYSEREAKELEEENVRLTKMKREQDRVVPRMKGLIILSDSDSDDSCTLSSDPPPTTDGYSCASDPKGQMADEEVVICPPSLSPLRNVYIVFLVI